MSELCSKCGVALKEGNAFCIKCGARRDDVPKPPAARQFCTKCGASLPAQTKFCTLCGAPARMAVPGAPPVSPPSSRTESKISASATPTHNNVGTQPFATASIGTTSAAPSSAAASGASTSKPVGIPKVPIVAAAIVVLFIVTLAVGATYLVHRVRQKAAQVEAQSQIEKSFAGLTGAAQKRNSQPAVQDAQKKLAALASAAQGPKTQAALPNLENKLPGPAKAAQANGQNPNKSATGEASSTGSAASSTTTPNPPPAPGSPAAIAAASAAADAALVPPPLPKSAPIAPVAGTGDPAHDWPLEYERTVGGSEADLVVRTGDINNLSFGWPKGFDPFSGQSTPSHPWPDINHIPPNAPPGTDRTIVGTSVMPVHMTIQHVARQADRIVIDSLVEPENQDGYSGSLGDCYFLRDNVFALMPAVLRDKLNRELTRRGVLSNLPDSVRHQAPNDLQNQLPGFFNVTTLKSAAECTRERELTMPTPITLSVGELPGKINAVVVQIFADDFQPKGMGSHFQLSLNGTRIPTFEYAINSLDQSGPIGKLVTLNLLPEYWPLLKAGEVELLIDDPTTHVRDGYAVDFVRILVNPRNFKYQVSLTATVTDADKHTPIAGATVNAGLDSVATDKAGKCELKGIPAGLVVATASAPGYDENSVPVDLPAGQNGNAEIPLHRHQESTAALEQSIAQTGEATIYGIHFDTGSSKLRSDSIPALDAVLGLIKNHAAARWIISGHTDNQGSDKLNIPLSKARAASVVSWLKEHGADVSRLAPQGFGSTRPVANNATANGRFLNRRVEVALAK